MARKSANVPEDPSSKALAEALAALQAHPLFRPLLSRTSISRPRPQKGQQVETPVVQGGLAAVDAAGRIHLSPNASATEGEWTWAVAHAVLHLGFGHLDASHEGSSGYGAAWNAACCVAVDRFLSNLKVGTPPGGLPLDLPSASESRLASEWAKGVPDRFRRLGVNATAADLVPLASSRYGWRPKTQVWEDLLASGLSGAVSAAVSMAGGDLATLSGTPGRRTPWQQALGWFVSSYPLLGALASSFKLVEDADVCRGYDISVAAISPVAGELYVNPHSGLSKSERRFVIAHELLHAGLRHDTRGGGRDPYYWNVSCDYAINGWLVEMGVGQMPSGLLYDPELKGMSAEEIYDRITTDIRRLRKLSTLRGEGLVDVLPGRLPAPGEAGYGLDLDELYRRALTQGLEYHHSSGRGYLPGGLEQEIRALAQPPVPWDVALARWFDEHFPALEPRRSYARPSRRQSSTPDIPRPSYLLPEELVSRRTFGVVLDTSGSMSTELLAKALGSIASYAQTHDVPGVRVVFCDAVAYDAGYLDASDIANRVRVRGRGGTVLQPGIDLLERADDFPDDGPILVITDGDCDRIRIRREHAFLVPAGARLPFEPVGPVFRFS